jgi:GST-like protein
VITLYTWTTPNGRKVPIMLEELGLAYEVRPVALPKGEQNAPEFVAVSPNHKIPVIVDDEGPGGRFTLFESGAILTYLAEKHGRFLPASGPARYVALEWLHWQVGGLAPMLGQLSFFAVRSPEKYPPAIQRFTEEAHRLLDVLERRLSESACLGGDDYTIADIAAYPWAVGVTTILAPTLGDVLSSRPSLQRWMKTVGDRPAVQRGMQVPQV